MSALQRARRPPGRRPGGADAPYRGLARFEREDARWFFGREDVTDLLAALADEEKPLPLVLVGPSGAGKLSVLRAGLVPRLTGRVGLVEPADAPLAALRAALADLSASGDAARPAIIVDQFEAVFTQCQDEAERREFVTDVCDLAKTVLVILALRADFYEHALRHPGLAAALQARQVVLGPMTPSRSAGRSRSRPGWPALTSKKAWSACCCATWPRRSRPASKPPTNRAQLRPRHPRHPPAPLPRHPRRDHQRRQQHHCQDQPPRLLTRPAPRSSPRRHHRPMVGRTPAPLPVRLTQGSKYRCGNPR